MEAIAEVAGRNQKEIHCHICTIVQITPHLTGQSLPRTISPPANITDMYKKKSRWIVRWAGDLICTAIKEEKYYNKISYLNHVPAIP